MEEKIILEKYPSVIAIFVSLSIFLLPNCAYPAAPVVNVELAHGNWISINCDNAEDINYPAQKQWLTQLNMDAAGGATVHQVDFYSDDSFVCFDPFPTSYAVPNKYTWNLSNRTNFTVSENKIIKKPGFIAVRNVYNPVLTDDVSVQTMDFTLKFKKPFEPGVNNVYVKLGSFPEDQYLIGETLLWQNEVSGWTNNGDGSWSTIPENVAVDVNYTFQVELLCTKNPEYSGTAIYLKPQAFILTAEWNNPESVYGPNTIIVHQEGETANYQLSEPVQWQKNLSLNRQDTFLTSVSVPVYDNSPEISTIVVINGKQHDASDNFIGNTFSIDVEGRNVIAAEVTTPTGRVWPLELFEDEISLDDIEYMSDSDLEALGIVAGTYTFDFHGLLGDTVTASINISLETPTQVPHITNLENWQKNISPSFNIIWDAVYDEYVNDTVIQVENSDENFDFFREQTPDVNSVRVLDAPYQTSLNCSVIFANTQNGELSSGIKWIVYNYSDQSIYLITLAGDFDGDEDVDYYDLAVLSDAWLSQNGDSNWNPACDISEPKDDIINLLDFAFFAQSWLAGVE